MPTDRKPSMSECEKVYALHPLSSAEIAAIKKHKQAMRRQWAVKAPKSRKEARKAVEKALVLGRLKKCPCEAITHSDNVCGKYPTEAHHLSYNPKHYLDVIWLCNTHHKQVWLNSKQGKLNTAKWCALYEIVQDIYEG